MILLLHHRYRFAGGEERAVADLEWLIREHLGEDVEVLERDSRAVSRARRGARARLAAGCARTRWPTPCGAPARASSTPTTCSRRTAGARWPPRASAGARVVLHLHNYRLVCAVGTCFTHGEDCTRCHGRNTLPGVRLNCRGGSRAESAAYAAGLALWQRRLAGAPTRSSCRRRSRCRGCASSARRSTARRCSARSSASSRERSRAAAGEYVLAAGRLTPEKGFADVIEACARGGPAARDRRRRARSARRSRPRAAARAFVGHVVRRRELARSCAPRAAVAVVPSRYAEILPLAALESMAAGLPTVAAASGGLIEAVPEEGLYPPGDVAALAARLRALWGDEAAGERALARARERWAPEVIAERLRDIYAATSAQQNVLVMRMSRRALPFLLLASLISARVRERRQEPEEGHLGSRRGRR